MQKKISFFKDYLWGYSHRNLPSYLVFFVTAKCNSRCDICFFWEQIKEGYHGEELTLDEISKITKKADKILHLLLSGGEPFLREDIAEIVRCFTLNNSTRLVSIPTNASLPDKIERDVKKILSENPFVHLNVNMSLDGIGKDHDLIRGHKGCFEKLEETYRRLKSIQGQYKNLGINIQTVFTKKNHEKMEELAAHVRDNFDVGFHGFSIVRGNPKDESIKDISFERTVQIHKLMEQTSSKRKTKLPFGKSINPIFNLMQEYYLGTLKYKRRVFPCLAGKKLLVLTGEGDLMPCEPFWFEPETRGEKSLEELCFGNVREFDYDIPGMLKTEKADSIRSYIAQERCYCLWGCVYFCGILYSPRAQIGLMRKFLNSKTKLHSK
ncbi:radical SAM protein [bacterium]|nr:radical SAM protein [bacterium]